MVVDAVCVWGGERVQGGAGEGGVVDKVALAGGGRGLEKAQGERCRRAALKREEDKHTRKQRGGGGAGVGTNERI